MANEAAWQAGWSDGKKQAGKDKKLSADKATPGFWGKVGLALQHIAPYKNGGPVKRTGLAILHKGEHVIPAKRRSKRAGKRSILKH